ncbi:MAG: pyridoxamine 5-phosphate oxidase, partial [Gemmatimonadaceae bacterium]|nr:pyridoxamine 5-phosphate oxidase [Gemmatimonadaceae bacterium]
EGGVPGAYFELQISEAVVTTVQGDELVVESWHPGRGVEVVRRG